MNNPLLGLLAKILQLLDSPVTWIFINELNSFIPWLSPLPLYGILTKTKEFDSSTGVLLESLSFIGAAEPFEIFSALDTDDCSSVNYTVELDGEEASSTIEPSRGTT
jgi:hypothetical protein